MLEDYYFQFVVDELPVYGFLGKVLEEGEEEGRENEKKVILFTHLHLDATFSGDRVISVTARTDPAKSIVLPADALAPVRADFAYSITWTESDAVPFSKRMDRYRRDTFLPQHLEVHWFAIANSCVTVLLLTAFLATILVRVLKADVSRYAGRPGSGGGRGGVSGAISSSSSSGSRGSQQPLEDPLFLDLDDGCDETGWKYLAHDVFRPPRHRALFCALLGAGAQVAAMAFGVFALAACGFFYPHARGAMQAALIGLYGATAGLAGFVSGSYHRQLGGSRGGGGGGAGGAGGGGDWVRCQLLTATVLAGPVFAAFCVSNSVAWSWGSTAALPAGTVALLLCGWAVATLPLTLLGGVVGKNSARPFDAPTRTARFAREVPALPWWRGACTQVLAAGFLPFSAIYIELYYVFLSVWGHKVRVRRSGFFFLRFRVFFLCPLLLRSSFFSPKLKTLPLKIQKTYTIYSILAIVFVILLLVTAFVTVALTYCEFFRYFNYYYYFAFPVADLSLLFFPKKKKTHPCSASRNLRKKNSPTRRRGPQVVVALPRLRRLHGPLRRRLRDLLLFFPKRHGGFDARVLLFRLHGSLLLGPEPDARVCGLEVQPGVRAGDVQGDQERVIREREGGESGEERRGRKERERAFLSSFNRKEGILRLFFSFLRLTTCFILAF